MLRRDPFRGGRAPPRSQQSRAKQGAAEPGLDRIRRLVPDARLPYTTTELEDLGCDGLAIAHADGNGLGKVFRHFDRYASGGNRPSIDRLRRFSLAPDRCPESAFRDALTLLGPRGRHEAWPIVPLVLGGDDFPAVLDGRQAMKFVRVFLVVFETATRDNADVQVIGLDRITSCAGVALVKPHFPFHAAWLPRYTRGRPDGGMI